jgi:hypothetical protein
LIIALARFGAAGIDKAFDFLGLLKQFSRRRRVTVVDARRRDVSSLGGIRAL